MLVPEEPSIREGEGRDAASRSTDGQDERLAVGQRTGGEAVLWPLRLVLLDEVVRPGELPAALVQGAQQAGNAQRVDPVADDGRRGVRWFVARRRAIPVLPHGRAGPCIEADDHLFLAAPIQGEEPP